jgi:hypothetical protein
MRQLMQGMVYASLWSGLLSTGVKHMYIREGVWWLGGRRHREGVRAMRGHRLENITLDFSLLAFRSPSFLAFPRQWCPQYSSN